MTDPFLIVGVFGLSASTHLRCQERLTVVFSGKSRLSIQGTFPIGRRSRKNIFRMESRDFPLSRMGSGSVFFDFSI